MDLRIKTAAQQLAEARAKGREHMSSFDITLHDNLWGMKVYSWQNATADEAIEFIMQLDSPVIWITSSEAEVDFSELSNWMASTVDVVLSFGTSNKMMRQYLEPKLGYYNRKDTLLETLQLVKSVANPGATLFFSPGLGKMSDAYKTAFEQFLSNQL